MQPVPFLNCRLEEGLYHDGAGMVEQHGDRAEFFARALHRGLDLRFIGNIGDEMLGDMAARPDRGGGGGCRFAVAVDDRHLGAFRREQFRGRPAHSGRAA
ncbi:hypothetical protein AJ88_24345 [Mesorhizobium amorphae CCBAU 01583]|nr:hypothetical protein AJ88_24345 [Mesorhizobium amorphae CCBAU 01583]